MASDGGADVEMIGIERIDGDAANSTLGSDGHASKYKGPGIAEVSGFEQPYSGLGIAGAIRLAGAHIQRLAGWISGIKDN